jgi:hypothetical protein
MELNFNWTKVDSSANSVSWLQQEERETQSVTAHKMHIFDEIFSKHQPGGTGMMCQSEFLQYPRKPSANLRGLGCWCSWPFYCNPNHVTRIIVAYRTCHTKSKGLCTIYQQQLRYIQAHHLNCSPVGLFNKDLSNQINEWQKSGERIVLLMDVNDHLLKSKFYQWLKREQIELEESTHKYWGPMPPYTHIASSSPIDGGYKSPEIEIVQLGLLSFVESPGDHRSFIIDISTRLLLGNFRYKVCRPVSRCLVTSQQQSVNRYNQIVQEQFHTHQVVERLNAVDKMTRYCGYLSPNWLRAMIIKLYKQMSKIRVHTEKNCQKILWPESDFSPTIQMWYNRIHVYLQLIRMKEGKKSNAGNIVRFAKRKHIEHPEELTMEDSRTGSKSAKSGRQI